MRLVLLHAAKQDMQQAAGVLQDAYNSKQQH
jgi:hypothetical protein